MTDFLFEELARQHPNISFIHHFPGKVGTNIVDDFLDHLPGLLWYGAQIPRWIILPLWNKFICMSPEEAGERTLFLATNERYPPAREHEGLGRVAGWTEIPRGVGTARSTVMRDGRGNGVYRTNWDGEVWLEMRLLEKLRGEEVGRTVWEHTMGVFERVVRRRDLGITS